MPIDWVELKCSSIKRSALERDASLKMSSDDTTATILNKKQVIINSFDIVSQ